MTPADDGKHRRRWRAVIIAATLSGIAAVLWAVERVTDHDTDEDAIGVSVPVNNGHANATPVQDYVQCAATVGHRPIQRSGVDPEYVVEGLRKLAGALGALNLGSLDLQIDLRAAAEHVLLSPTSTATTAVVRDGLLEAADALEPERGNREVNLRRLAESIRPDRPLLDQQAAVQEFLRECAKAMQTARLQGQT